MVEDSLMFVGKAKWNNIFLSLFVSLIHFVPSVTSRTILSANKRCLTKINRGKGTRLSMVKESLVFVGEAKWK